MHFHVTWILISNTHPFKILWLIIHIRVTHHNLCPQSHAERSNNQLAALWLLKFKCVKIRQDSLGYLITNINYHSHSKYWICNPLCGWCKLKTSNETDMLICMTIKNPCFPNFSKGNYAWRSWHCVAGFPMFWRIMVPSASQPVVHHIPQGPESPATPLLEPQIKIIQQWNLNEYLLV
jgi:hypothetical protein